MGLFGKAFRIGPGTNQIRTWLYHSQIRSIQRGTITVASASLTGTATITSVNMNNAVLAFLGATSNNAAVNIVADMMHLALTNATTITATRAVTGASDNTASFSIIEFFPGMIKSIQRGTISLASASSNTATITSVNPLKSQIDCLGFLVSAASDQELPRITLTDAVTVTATKFSSAADTTIVGYQVVEWW